MARNDEDIIGVEDYCGNNLIPTWERSQQFDFGIKEYFGEEFPFIWERPRWWNLEGTEISENKNTKMEDKTMTEVKIRKTETTGDYSMETVFEAKELEYLNEGIIKGLFGTAGGETITEKEVKLADVPVSQPGMKCEVVAIYDNAGIPSIMRRFTRVTNKELFGGSDKPHPAFVIGGEVYDEIYISVYENCEINGKPYSLPYQKAWVNITNDDAAAACFSKGEGWHLLTAAEWGLLANLSLKNGTLPHGNTSRGRYHSDGAERGKVYDDYYTLTGSGPATWTHDHTPEGVHDLCGNHWEMVRGLRIKDGQLYAAENNNAALDIDLSLEGEEWWSIVDNDGKPVRVSVYGKITFTTAEDIEQDYTGDCWQDVNIECESEQLKELALYAGEPDTYCYVDSTDGEYFPLRGGGWTDGAYAGVFYTTLGYPRSYVSTYVGFRSAYFKKKN